MKDILFEKIKIKNFLSIKDEVVFDIKSGLNLITGENRDSESRNGVGKSSLIESLYWCLFGNTIRDIKNDKIIHNQSDKNCCVTLDFSIKNLDINKKYSIKRTLEPSKIQIVEDEKDITLSTIPKNDEFIKQLLGANEEVFQNAVIMTANNTIPFMAQKKIDKRKFIEGILNMEVFGEMLLKVRSDFNDLKKKNDITSTILNEKNKNIILYNNQIQKNKELNNTKIQNLNLKIEENNKKIKIYSDIDSINDKITKNKESIDKLFETNNKSDAGIDKIEDIISNKNKNKIEIDFEIKELTSKLKSIDKTPDICPTCKRKYDKEKNSPCIDVDSIKGELDSKKIISKQYESELFELNDKKRKLKEIITSNLNKINALKDEINKLNLNLSDVKNLKDKNEEILVQIEEIKNIEDPLLENIQKTEEEIQNISKELEQIQKDLLILDNCKFVLSEEGVKSFIVKKMISVLNSQLNYYLKTLNAPCTCMFDESFEETIINNQGKECSYFNFSGGERKRIDIAVLFMFQDILKLQTGIHFNLSMYDELLDSALDSSGTSKIMEILKERSNNSSESIYIVSHNKSTQVNGFDNIIMLEKKDGKTTIVS
jgi:DNA repair exonuclease SbcCD ATPase subunit